MSKHRPYDEKWFERSYRLATYLGLDWPKALPQAGTDPNGLVAVPPVPGYQHRKWTPALVEAFMAIREKELARKNLNRIGPIVPDDTQRRADDIWWVLHPDESITIELVFSRETLKKIQPQSAYEDCSSVLRAEVSADNTATVERPTTPSRMLESEYNIHTKVPFVKPGFPIYQSHFDRVLGALRAIGVVIRAGEARDLAQELEIEEDPQSPPRKNQIVLGRSVPI